MISSYLLAPQKFNSNPNPGGDIYPDTGGALELEHSQMALIQFFESFGFFWIHGILPSYDNRPELDD